MESIYITENPEQEKKSKGIIYNLHYYIIYNK